MQKEEEDTICSICYELPKNAFECESCGQLFCEGCTKRLSHSKISECPMCRKENRQFVPAKLRKTINAIKKPCPHCKKPIELISISDHIKKCEYKKIDCRECNMQIPIRAIVEHTKQKHSNKIDKIIKNYQL